MSRAIVLPALAINFRGYDGSTGKTTPPASVVADVHATAAELRTAAEHAYRDLAVLTPDRAGRVRLVDFANQIRPRTLV